MEEGCRLGPVISESQVLCMVNDSVNIFAILVIWLSNGNEFIKSFLANDLVFQSVVINTIQALMPAVVCFWEMTIFLFRRHNGS